MNIVVSLHDVHPSSLPAIARQRADLRARGVNKVSLLVVPNWHGQEPIENHADFIATITQWQNEGDEVVLHGYTHSCAELNERAKDWFWTRLYTNREAEFLVLTEEETKLRLYAGRKLFEVFDWNVSGFIAPAWLMAANTSSCLRDAKFSYTVDRKSVFPLSGPIKSIASTSLCYSTRSRWRRVSSLIWNRALASRMSRHPLLRISLHPGDVTYPKIWHQILRLTQSAMHAGRRSQTYRDCVAGVQGKIACIAEGQF